MAPHKKNCWILKICFLSVILNVTLMMSGCGAGSSSKSNSNNSNNASDQVVQDVSNSGNINNPGQNQNTLDTTFPDLYLPALLTVNAVSADGISLGDPKIREFISSATASDNKDGDLVEISHDTPDVLPLGVTTITFSVSDAAGNKTTGTSKINVVDTSVPQLTVPENLEIEAPSYFGVDVTEQSVLDFINKVSASDPIDDDASLTISNNMPEILPLGNTEIIFTVKDISGNASSATSNIIVSIPPPKPLLWKQLNGLLGNNTLLGLAHDGNIFVAVGEYGTILTSPDGLSWVARDSGTITILKSVAYSDLLNLFVVVGEKGVIMTSNDGVSWTHRTVSPSGSDLNSVIWDGNNFVLTNIDGKVYKSIDGVEWSAQEINNNSSLNDIAWSINDEQYVAVGRSGVVYFSDQDDVWDKLIKEPDGTLSNLSPDENFTDIEVNGMPGIYVAVTENINPNVDEKGNILVSRDFGQTWEKQFLDKKEKLQSVIWNGSAYVVVGDNGLVLESAIDIDDNFSWLPYDAKTKVGINNVLFVNSQYVFIGEFGTKIVGSALDSLDNITQGSTNNWHAIARNVLSGLYVVVGALGEVMTSIDSSSWVAQSSPIQDSLNSVVFGNGQFVAVGDNGTVVSSLDGFNWVLQASGTINNLSEIIWNPDLEQFVAVGAKGTVLLGIPGTDSSISWSVQTVNTFNYKGVVWSRENAKYIMVSDSIGAIIYQGVEDLNAPNSLIWTIVDTSDIGSKLLTVHWNGSKFIAPALFGKLFFSSDGNNWEEGNNFSFASFNSMSFNGTKYVAVTNNGEVYISIDLGISWTIQETGIFNSLDDVFWDGSRFLAVGEGGAIITSE